MIIHRMLSLLDDKSLKMVDLCRHLEINTSTMTNWKNRGTDPPAKYIAPICEFLGVSYEYLLTGKETPATFISPDNAEWLSLIYQLPLEKQYELKGYIKRMIDESVAADDLLHRTGTTNSAK